MAEKTNIRLFQVNTPIELNKQTDKYLNAGVMGYEGQFSSVEGNQTARAALYKKNNYLILSNDRNITLPGQFIVGMWFKFMKGRFTPDIYVVIHFDDTEATLTDTVAGETFEYTKYTNEVYATLPTVDGEGNAIDYTTDAHYLSIIRDTSGNITFRLDGNVFHTANNTSPLDLTGQSCIIINALGYNESVTGSIIIVDDLVISDEMIPEVVGSTNPTDYLISYAIDPSYIPWTATSNLAFLKVY